MDDMDREFKRLLSQKTNDYESFVLHLTPKEALLIDWIFTVHSWDYDLFERLRSKEKINLRQRIGSAFLAYNSGKDEEETKILNNVLHPVEILKTELLELIVVVPNSYQIGIDDIGLSLKQKLYRSLLKIAPEQEG